MRASAVDFDGDGRAEWLTIGPEGESALSGARVVEVWRGGERGPEVDAAAARFKFEGYAAFPEFLDFDGDGRTDLALSTLDVPATPEALARSARIRWTWHLLRSDPSGLLERSPSGRVVEEWAPESYGGGRTAATFAGDFDGDGVADFAAIDPTGVFRAHRLVRGGGGRFEREDRPLFRVSFDRWPRDLEVLRLDEDGRADAVVYHDSGFTALATR